MYCSQPSRPLQVGEDMASMDAVYPSPASALARGRRRRRPETRLRHRTMPVTFAEIKMLQLYCKRPMSSTRRIKADNDDDDCFFREVDEENLECEHQSVASVTSIVSAVEERRRRPDVLDERLGPQFAEFRRRRARRDQLREPDEPNPTMDSSSASSRSVSEPRVLEPS